MVKAKAFAGVVGGVAAISAAAFMMLSNSSPFVTIAEAKTMRADNLHLEGDIDKKSISVDSANALIAFNITDKNGDKIEVVHHGMPPANLGEATKVVAVGGIKNGRFESTKLLTKCPSKYESEGKLRKPMN